ncbi:MAG: GGDEF domain-containing protein [Desulfatitalea sp.]
MRRVALVLMVLIIGSHAYAQETRKVLVLHSYHLGCEWTDRITEGIQSVFAPFAKDIQLHFEYLDTLRHGGPDYFPTLADFYRFKLKDTRFDAVIVSDDDALRFIRQFAPRLAPGVPVVFCGINAREDALSPAQENETGVVEQIGHQATLSLMLQLHPQCRRIIFLVDNGMADGGLVEGMKTMLTLLEPQVEVEIWDGVAPAELPAKLVGLTPADLIYLLLFDHDKGSDDARAADMVRLVTRWSPVAVYSSLDFYLGKGIVGGMITSAFRQGELAGQMALRILSGQRVGDIAPMTRSPNQYMFDGRKLKQFYLNQSQLPPGSAVIHEQPVFWDRHGTLFLGVAAGTIVLAIVMLGFVMRQKDKQRLLALNNVELDGRIKEKSAQLLLASQRLKKQSLIDGVTGMPNRRYIFQRLAEEIKKAQRYGLPLSVMLFDIDGFKLINDRYGYLTGDKVLRDVGQAIRRSVREIDLVGRYGGEDFLVLLPNTTIDQAWISATRIRESLQALQWEQGQVQVTVSGGLALARKNSPAELISQVDARLRIAKQQGGDRVVADEAGRSKDAE